MSKDMSPVMIEARKWAFDVLWGSAGDKDDGKFTLSRILPWAEALARWAVTGDIPEPLREDGESQS